MYCSTRGSDLLDNKHGSKKKHTHTFGAGHQWKQLADQIEECSVLDPLLEYKHLDCYHLIQELFWMMFIAALLGFPMGKWSH